MSEYINNELIEHIFVLHKASGLIAIRQKIYHDILIGSIKGCFERKKSLQIFMDGIGEWHIINMQTIE